MDDFRAHRVYRFETFVLDISERQFVHNGVVVSLTPKAFDVLAYLVERSGHLVEKNELMQNIWPNSYVEEANISRIIHTLRKTLGSGSKGEQFIQTVSKRGYRFTAAVSTDDAVPGALARDKPSNQRIRLFWLRVAVICVLGGILIIAGLMLRQTGETQSWSFDGMTPARVTTSGDVLGPTVSPDGRLLTYIKQTDGLFGLVGHELASKREWTLVPFQKNARFWGLRFSPDGNFVYYIENKDNDLGTLYRVASAGGAVQKLSYHVNGGVAISPDGEHIAFIRTEKDVGRVSIQITDKDGNGARTFVETSANDMYMSLDWSPDGSSITYAYREMKGDAPQYSIVDKPLDGTAERRIGETGTQVVISAAWLRNKEGLIINAIDETSKLPQIYFRDYPGGMDRRVTNDLIYYYSTSITSDGRSIFTQRIEQDRHIWNLPDVRSPDARQLTFEKEQHFDAVDWLSDDRIVFDLDQNGSHQARNLWALDLNGAKAEQLTSGTGNNTTPKLSPDGRSILFLSDRSGTKQVWSINLDGTAARQITNLNHRVYDHCLSPDGRWIYLQYSIGGEGRLARMPAEGGELTQIGGKEIFEWSLSPDGKNLVYRTLEESGRFVIKIRTVDDAQTLQILPIEASNHLVWSKSGNDIYFVNDTDIRKNVWRQPLSGGAAVPVTNFKDAEILAFAESADGKSLSIIRSRTSFDAVRFDFAK